MTNIVNGINYDAFAENLNDKLDIDASNATQATENWVKSVGGGGWCSRSINSSSCV